MDRSGLKACTPTWLKREAWFSDLRRSDIVCGIGHNPKGEFNKRNQWIFLAWQIILTVYWFSMWVFRLSNFRSRNELPRLYSDYLTNWNDTLILMHLVCLLILIMTNLPFKNVARLDEAAPWYYYVHQMLYEMCLPVALLVTIVNYGVLKDWGNDENGKIAVGSFHAHMINSVVMGLQFFFLNTPIRLFHVVATWLLALIYVLNTFIAFKVDELRDAPYAFLNWKDGKSDFVFDTKSTIALFIFGVITSVHLTFYFLHFLKFFIKSKIQKGQAAANEPRPTDDKQIERSDDAPKFYQKIVSDAKSYFSVVA